MLDDETGEPLYQRADDTAEALKTRLVRWVGPMVIWLPAKKRFSTDQFYLLIGIVFCSLQDGS